MRVNVTKSFLPPIEEYQVYLQQIWDNVWLTNNGPLLKQLEVEIRNYLKINNLLFLTNGTIALQLAIKALKLNGEIITTPFSYCATTTSILWENCEPIFVDINEHDLNINPDLIEAAITPKTQAIMATHVYGYPCDVKKIEKIAQKHNLKVIYDGAHCFGATYEGKSVLYYGDISTCSFHSTKVFHTVEGGCIICKDNELLDTLYQMRTFGHINDDYFNVGINAKNSEFHAAMGLCNLPHLSAIIQSRKQVFEQYDAQLIWGKIRKPLNPDLMDFEYNYAYYPIVFEEEGVILKVIEELQKEDIFPRRYFYPSLNKLEYLEKSQECPVSERISQQVLSLPLAHDLSSETIKKVTEIINKLVN